MKIQTLFGAALSVVLAAGLAGCSSEKYHYQTVENDPLNAKMYTLPNGLKVYMTVNKEQPRIQTYIAVRTGGKNDPAETTGLAHYLEHLMFKGTSHFGTQNYEAERPLLEEITALYEVYRTKTDDAERKAIYHTIDSISGIAATYAIPNEYDKLMSLIGADGTNAYTSEDVTCYVEDIPSNQVENWAKIQSDRFKNPVFRLFHTELEAVYEEKNMSMTRDISKAIESLNSALFPTHPYGTQTVIGTQEHLKNPSLINIRNYFDTWYVPNNVAICLSGDFDPDQMVDLISQYFGDWKASAGVPQNQWAAAEPIAQPVVKEVVGQENEMVLMGWRFPAAATRDAEVMSFVSSLLYNGKAGLFDLDLNQAQRVMAAQIWSDCMADASSLITIGVPMPGQSLDEVRDLMLAEIKKLAAGDFDDNLIASVLTDIKLSEQKQLENNSDRANMFVESFVNGQDWSDYVGSTERLSKITKQDVMAFAAKYLSDQNYAIVYKRMGTDPNQQVIKKPAITPIQANRDAVSDFVKELSAQAVAPIEPVFVDYAKDLQHAQLQHGQEVLYKKNETNQTFNLYYSYEMGSWSDKVLPLVSEYTDFIGTSTMSPEEVQKAFYSLGCNVRISCSSRRFYISLSGLDENLEAAVALLDQVLNDAQPDEKVYASYLDQILQMRLIQKTRQNSISSALNTYATYGADYVKANTVSEAELKALKGSDLTDRLHNLQNLQHQVLYYGPSELSAVTALLDAKHVTAESLQPVPANTIYSKIEPKETVTYFAPYTANNSVLIQSTTYGQAYDPAKTPWVNMYNEYFGGSMNGIVFQEMRETRALAYSAYAVLRAPVYKDAQYTYHAQITTQTDKLRDALNHFQEIINDIPQSEAAFQNAKQALESRLRTQRTTRSSVLWSYVDAQDLGLTEDPDKAVFEQTRQMTLADLVAFQQEWVKGRSYINTLVADPKLVDLNIFKQAGKVINVSVDEAFGF